MSKARSCCCCACVDTNTTGLLESFGKFIEVLNPGCSFYCCCWQNVYSVPNNIQQLENNTDTKTKDDVNIRLVTAVQYQIEASQSRVAFYSLQTPTKQIESYIDNCIRGHVPSMTLQQVFESKDTLSNAVKDDLAVQMGNFGYKILNTLLTSIVLPPAVQEAMNSKTTNLQYRLATVEKAEANRIAVVAEANAQKEVTLAKAEAEARQTVVQAEASARRTIMEAEARARAQELDGQGAAKKQAEANQGLTAASLNVKEKLGVSAEKAAELVMANTYLDTMRSIGAQGKSTLLFPYTSNVQDALRNTFIQGHEATK